MEKGTLAVLLGMLTIIGGLTLEALLTKPLFALMQRRYPEFAKSRNLIWVWYGLSFGAMMLGLLVMAVLGSG